MQNFKHSKIIDISLPINEHTPMYPGNAPVQVETFGSSSGTSFNSRIFLSTHTATHMDSPRHAFQEGIGVEKISLEHVVGVSRVLDCTHCKGKIRASDLKDQNIRKGERILLKTENSHRGYDNFYEDYTYLTSEAAVYVAKLSITLVGIDSLSIKKKGSKDNTAHTAFLSQNIPILEGINLKEVAEGEYFLIALPLSLTGLDGSPVRAVLLK